MEAEDTPFIELVLAEHVEEKGDVEEYRSGEPQQCDIGAVAAAVDPTNLLHIGSNGSYVFIWLLNINFQRIYYVHSI